MIRRTFSTNEPRELSAQAKLPLPWPQSRMEAISSALDYAADLIDAADRVVALSRHNPADDQTHER